jgi:Uncharacterized conserved protein
MIAFYILMGLLVILLAMVIRAYNKLVKLKTHMEESWSIVDVFLNKRYDLIPNLVETVKGYATHERETLESVILARNQALGARNVSEKVESESMLTNTLSRLMIVSEKYPELRANENFMYLQKELSGLEGEIERSRRYYNACVRDNNISIRVFPSNIIANMFNFDEGKFFEVAEAKREAPKVSFGK